MRMKSPGMIADEALAFSDGPTVQAEKSFGHFHQQFGYVTIRHGLSARALVAYPIGILLQGIFREQNSPLMGAFGAVDPARETSKFFGILASLTLAINKLGSEIETSLLGGPEWLKNAVEGDLGSFRDGNRSPHH